MPAKRTNKVNAKKRRGSKPAARARKDRLIQTRVPEELQTTLKEEADRRRLTVSHLIRSILEDTFHLVDDVVTDIDKVVNDSVDLAMNVGRNARKLAKQIPQSKPAKTNWDRGLEDVYGWSELVLQRPAKCKRCSDELERGEQAFVGLTDKPRRSRVWLCGACMRAV